MEPYRDSGRGSHSYFLDSGGVCFLCLKLSKEAEKLNVGGFAGFKKCSLLKISRFLRIDIDKIYPEIFINSKLVKRKNEVFVSLCEQCLSVYNLFDELYNILEETDILMKGCINNMQKVIHEGQQDLYRLEEMKRRSRVERDTKIIESLRKRIMLKCERNLKSSGPRVQLSRVTDDEVKQWESKRSIQAPVQSTSFQIVTKREPEPDPLEVNDFIMEEESSPAIEWNDETSYSYSDAIGLPPTDIEFNLNQSIGISSSVSSTSSLEDSEFVSCPYCKFQVSRRRLANLTTHLANNHVKHFFPNLFPQLKMTSADFQEVVKIHLERFINEDSCSVCNKKYNISSRYLLLLHMRTHLLKDHVTELEKSLMESLPSTNPQEFEQEEVNEVILQEQAPPRLKKPSPFKIKLPPTDNELNLNQQQSFEVNDFIEEDSPPTMEWYGEISNSYSDSKDLPPADQSTSHSPSTPASKSTNKDPEGHEAPETLSTSAFVSCPCCDFQVQRRRRTNLNTHLVNNHVEHFFPNLFPQVKMTLAKFQKVVMCHLERFIVKDSCSLCNKKHNISSRLLLILHLKIHLLKEHGPELEESLTERLSSTNSQEDLAPTDMGSTQRRLNKAPLHSSSTFQFVSCPYCRFQVARKRRANLVTHLGTNHVEHFFPNLYPRLKISLAAFQNMVTRHVKRFIEEDNCSLCHKSYNISCKSLKFLHMKVHLLNEHGPEVEKSLMESSSSSSSLREAVEFEERPPSSSWNRIKLNRKVGQFKCTYCPWTHRVRWALTHHIVAQHPEHYFPNVFQKLEISSQDFKLLLSEGVNQFTKDGNCTLCNMKCSIVKKADQYRYLKGHLLREHGKKLEEKMIEIGKSSPEGFQNMTSKLEVINMLPAVPLSSSSSSSVKVAKVNEVREVIPEAIN